MLEGGDQRRAYRTDRAETFRQHVRGKWRAHHAGIRTNRVHDSGLSLAEATMAEFKLWPFVFWFCSVPLACNSRMSCVMLLCQGRGLEGRTPMTVCERSTCFCTVANDKCATKMLIPCNEAIQRNVLESAPNYVREVNIPSEMYLHKLVG